MRDQKAGKCIAWTHSPYCAVPMRRGILSECIRHSRKERNQKGKRVKKLEKSQKEGMHVSGRKEKVLLGSHTVSLQGNAGPNEGDIGGTQRQAANQDRQVVVGVLREDMVYPLSGNSASNSEVPPEYPVGEPLVVKPSEGSIDGDVGGISSVVRIRGMVIALAGRV